MYVDIGTHLAVPVVQVVHCQSLCTLLPVSQQALTYRGTQEVRGSLEALVHQILQAL